MVAQNTVRLYGVNQVFRLVEGIWLHRQSRRIRFFIRKDLFTYLLLLIYLRLILLHICATSSKLPSNISTMSTYTLMRT